MTLTGGRTLTETDIARSNLSTVAEDVMAVGTIRALVGTSDTSIRRHIQKGTLKPVGLLKAGPYVSQVFLVDNVVDEWYPDGPDHATEDKLDEMRKAHTFFFGPEGRVFRLLDCMVLIPKEE